MIALDTNILVYAHRKDSTWHDEAARCLRTVAEADAPWAIPWPCLHEFYAIATHPRIYDPPSTPGQAADQIEAWLESPRLVLIAESPACWKILKDLLQTGRITGAQVHDARVAAICIHHGVKVLWTADRDFSRFGALRTRNPLVRESGRP